MKEGKNLMGGLLVTLGCSWVKGVGAQYVDGMTLEQYQEVTEKGYRELDTPYTFIHHLAERNNLELVNFGVGGSSNKKQFRKATEFFSSDEFKKYQDKYSTIIVLWGITSTARTEVYNIHKKKFENLLYKADHKGTKFILEHNRIMVENYYDHEIEVYLLTNQMKHWDDFFELKGVKNMWFDILNHHDYTQNFDNLCLNDGDGPRDLLSRITTHKTKDKFHFSLWKTDCDRVKKGVFTKTLNPYSYHPTKKGHEKIFNLLDPYVKNLLRDS
tara:strand:- start:18 stop:830 length:813 start_codon:yes stop_codon:yes gene_type:complete